jgi:N-acylneuraminate cytidylyltransferase
LTTLALVTARGGSRGFSGKNLALLDGQPLVAWAVAAGRQAASVDRVLVSTDDAAIRDAAVDAGAEALFLRPAALAADDTEDLPVFLHALDALIDLEGAEPDVVVHLRPTSPLRPAGLVDAAVATLLDDPRATSARSVAESPVTPYKMWNVHGRLMTPLLAAPPGVDEPYNAPRQRLPRTWWQTGHVDAARVSTLRAGSMTGGRPLAVPVDGSLAVDIDSPADLERAARLLEHGAAVVRPDGPSASAALARARLVVFDFDGVMTDNRVWVDAAGRESVACDRSDGHGVRMLREAGLSLAVLSTEENEVVAARCQKLRLPVRQGLGDDKGRALADLARAEGVPLDEVVFVGNDVNDLDCLRMAGLAVVPADAHPEARAAARLVLRRRGGHGAVRELADALLAARRRFGAGAA